MEFDCRSYCHLVLIKALNIFEKLKFKAELILLQLAILCKCKYQLKGENFL